MRHNCRLQYNNHKTLKCSYMKLIITSFTTILKWISLTMNCERIGTMSHCSYCQVFVKSYNFVFEKINIQYAPYQKLQKNQVKCISIRHVFCQKSTRKLRFCITSVLVSTNMSMTLFRKHFVLSKTIHKGPTVPK